MFLIFRKTVLISYLWGLCKSTYYFVAIPCNHDTIYIYIKKTLKLILHEVTVDCCKKCTRLVSSFRWVRIMSKIASDVALYLKSGANMFVLCMIENPWCRAKGSKFRNCSPFLKKKFRYSPRPMNPLTYYFGFKMSHFCSKTCKERLFF